MINKWLHQLSRLCSPINSLLKNPQNLKAEIRATEFDIAHDFISFSAIFNDISVVSIKAKNLMLMHCLTGEWFKRNLGVDYITVYIPHKKLEELSLDINNIKTSFGFALRNDRAMDIFINEIEPLIASGRVIIRPEKFLLLKKKEKNEKGGDNWEALSADPYSPFDLWRVEKKEEGKVIPIRFVTQEQSVERELFEISIPFISGITYSDLNKIISDEFDLISSLRSSLKQLILESKKSKEIKEILKDLVEPNIDRVNRKLKSIKNIHRLKIAGATIGTVALAYASIKSLGLAQAITSVAGAGGVGLIGNKYSEYRAKIEEVKENPYYFLWRCKKINKRA